MSDDTIKLSKDTIDVFKKMYEVNQGLKLVKGEKTLKSKSTDNSMIVNAEIEEEFPRDFHIYNLKEFLSVVTVISDPILDFSADSVLEIRSDDGKQKIKYSESDPTFVKSYVEKDITMPKVDFTVTVAAEQFSSIMKSVSIMKLEYVGFIGDGSKINLVAFNRNNGDKGVNNNFAIELADTEDTFEMFYKMDMQNVSVLLGEGDLTFEVSRKKISKVTTESGKIFWIGMNASSKYDD